MPIFIAKDIESMPIDIVLARDYNSAQIYWQGKGVVAHTVTMRKESDLEDHITGVLPILSTKEINTGNALNPKKIIAVKRK
jgi:hypothetical protein